MLETNFEASIVVRACRHAQSLGCLQRLPARCKGMVVLVSVCLLGCLLLLLVFVEQPRQYCHGRTSRHTSHCVDAVYVLASTCCAHADCYQTGIAAPPTLLLTALERPRAGTAMPGFIYVEADN
jgi:hypothetical protein